MESAVSAWRTARAFAFYSISSSAVLISPADAPPDVAVLDLSVPGRSVFGELGRLKTMLPSVPAIALIERAGPEAVLIPIQAGASGCIVKPAGADSLVSHLVRAAEGLPVLCPESQRTLISYLHDIGRLPGMAALTGRERQLWVCLARKMSDKEIADAFGISAQTVHVHAVNLFRKLGVHSRRHAGDKLLRIKLPESSLTDF